MLAEVSNSNWSDGQMRTYEVTRGPHYNAYVTMTVYLSLTRNSFCISFRAKCVIYRQNISSRLYVVLKGTCSLASQARLNTGE